MSTLEMRNVSKDYRLRDGRNSRILRAVNNVSFTLEAGKTVALVGQSGSGKSTLAKILLQLERPTSGEILLDGKAVARHGRGLRDYRNSVQMVFQDPFASLNPRMTIGDIVAAPLAIHGEGSVAERPKRVNEMLSLVGLPARFAERRTRCNACIRHPRYPCRPWSVRSPSDVR